MKHITGFKFYWLLLMFFIGYSSGLYAQCPPNIGFESGSFELWQCSTGTINRADGVISLNPTGAIPGRHTLFQNIPPAINDRFGGFPINCPNGSGYSIQLGNSSTGSQAEQVSYLINIPANENNYSIIYNYAVVFQNPSHAEWEQPKFTANVYDVTNNQYIDCSSFSYAAAASLPGFKMSEDSVFYKPWTPVTIKLSGYAGHSIRIEFTTNDCTRGGHFGYAYVDVNQNCSSPISGNTQCASDSSQTLVAPFGFGGYRWFNDNFTKVLGLEQTLTLKPVPTPGTVFAVEITPFSGQGCTDTVYTTIAYSGEILTLKVPTNTIQSCISSPIDITTPLITSGSSPNLELTYYTDLTQNNYVARPNSINTSGIYYIKAVNSVGCTAIKPVSLELVDYPDLTVTDPIPVPRPETIDLLATVKGITANLNFTYWKDSLLTQALSNPHAIDKNGRYFIKATNQAGCTVSYGVNVIIAEVEITPPNAFSPNNDGIHDQWMIEKIEYYPECVIEIFNRLGQKVFNSVGYNKPWDGKFNGIDQPVATYYYIIKRRADLKPIGGSVTLVR